MKSIFSWYTVFFPYVLFLNVLSFGEDKLGLGTILFTLIMLLLLVLSIIFSEKLTLNRNIFFGLISFLVIQALKIFTYNIGDIDFSLFIGYLGTWLFFIINFVFSSIHLKNSLYKSVFIRRLSNSFLISSLIGIFHYYFFYSMPFMDPTYGSDEFGTIFNVADYDLMRFRESSIFFGPNVNAYMSVLGYLCIIFSLIEKGIGKVFKSPKYWLGTTIHIWNIVLSDSRSGFLILILLTLFIINEKGMINYKLPALTKYIVFLILLFSTVIYINNQPRFNIESLIQDGRIVKIVAGIQILISNNLNILIGTPLNFKWILDDVSVSDNMYIALLLYVGIIGVIIMGFTIINIFKKINSLINSTQDLPYNLLAKYYLIMILLAGVFSIPIAMMPPMVYLGIILGGVKFNSRP